MRDDRDNRERAASDTLEKLKPLFGSEIPESEREKIREWYLEPSYREEKEEALKVLFDEFIESEEPTDYSYKRLRELESRMDSIYKSGRVQKGGRVRRRWLGITASIAILAGLIGAFMLLTSPDGERQIAMEVVTTKQSEESSIELQSGTKVELKERSTLSYSEWEFVVEGEASFSVEPTPEPVVVRAKQLTITVLGTEFDVVARAEEPFVDVLLYSGRVEVSVGELKEELTEGNRLRYDYRKEEFEIAALKERDDYSVRSKRLEEIFNEIEEYYGVEIVYQSGVNLDEQYIFRSIENSDLIEVLTALEKVSGEYSYKIERDRIVVNTK